jgi:hypothetical protein|tara:strand:+ start:499 stop:687 length:189 start_codon:yes stop_codon:yes gene_type:complete
MTAHKKSREQALLACAIYFRSQSDIKQPNLTLAPRYMDHTHVYIFDFIAFIDLPSRAQLDLT